jgi:glycosyltransferase involved in cell wall biosynthesis
MRIAFVSKEVAGVRGGGIGTYVAEAGKALTAFGHEVWLITQDPGAELRPRLGELPGFHRVVVNGDGVAARMRLFHGHGHAEYSLLAHRTLQALPVRFDYIEFADYEAEGFVPLLEQHLFDSYGDTVLGLMLHSPTWECFRDDQQAHRASIAIREVCALEEHAIRLAPVRTAPSRGMRDAVTERLGLPADTTLVRYPMALPAALPEPVRSRPTLAELRFTYFGRIEPRKGVQNLIEAFRRMPELKLELIGGDVPYSPYGTSFRAWLSRELPANVRFVEPLPREELLRRLQRTDVCIFPSLFENWPNVCIEAMAAARVVIGSVHGGMGEMIEHGRSGFHVDGRDPADIRRVVQHELRDALPRLAEIGTAAAQRIRELSAPQTYVQAIERLVLDARERRRAPPPPAPAARRVSVVIPFHNDRDTIDHAVDSALRQSHRELEVLLVDDGSPLADAGEILARQAAKDPRVRFVRKPNGGLGSARNFGIEHSRGDYVLFLDADNELREDYAATGVAVLERFPDRMFIVPFIQFFDGATRQDCGVYNPMPFDRATALLINRFGDAGAMFRRTLFTGHGLRYDTVPTGYEDWALWMDLQRLGLRGEIVPRVLYDYRIRAESMIRKDSLPMHPTLVGWLIEHHYPADSEAEKRALITLFQTAGQSCARILYGIAQDDLPYQPPPPMVQAPDAGMPAVPAPDRNGTPHAPPPLRHKLVDELARYARKVPGLGPTLRFLAEQAFRAGRVVRGRRK